MESDARKFEEMKHTHTHTLHVTFGPCEGEARTDVVCGRVDMIFKTYRALYTKGIRKNEVNIIKRKVGAMSPDKATKTSEVRDKIRKWKEDLRYLREVGEDAMPAPERAALTLSILPSELMLSRKWETEENLKK